MKILSINSGTGGAIAAVDASSGRLLFFYEAEKDSFPKNTSATMESFLEGSAWFSELPGTLARTGTARTRLEYNTLTGAGYFGVGKKSEIVGNTSFFGQIIPAFSSTHERGHIWAAYAMSPFPQGEPCYVLVMDDVLGDFYEIDSELRIHHVGRFMENPVHRFSMVYALADRGSAGPISIGLDDFGKMMEAASFGDASEADEESLAVTERVVEFGTPEPFSDILCGMETYSQRFQNLAAALSDAIFSKLSDFVGQHLDKDIPLVVGGEGALNCIWSTGLKESGLFPDIFITPTANDAGCAIGTAVDAMRHFTGRAKLDWSIYSGQPFQDDRSAVPDLDGGKDVDLKEVADALLDGKILGWARGSCEIGKRALGNRSILAAPFDDATRSRINWIKARAEDCPVSPICREEDISQHFECIEPSPYMLYLTRVSNPTLRAITHVDGTARLQTVSRTQNPFLHALLTAFKERSGVGVLCNTSLNFKNAGFINKTSDLHHFSRTKHLDGFLAGVRFYWT